MYRNKTFNRKKVMIVFVAVFFIMMFLIGRLVYLMIFCSEYYGNKAENLHERERDIKAARGKLLDANGTVLATNKSVCTISVIHNQMEEPEKVIAMLVKELGISEEAARKRVEKVSSIERVKTNVAKETGDAIRAYGLSGVKVDEDFKRYYPYGELASQVLGFTGGDNQGIIGLEVKYEEYHWNQIFDDYRLYYSPTREMSIEEYLESYKMQNIDIHRTYTLHNFHSGYIWVVIHFDVVDKNGNIMTDNQGGPKVGTKFKIEKQNGKWQITDFYEQNFYETMSDKIYYLLPNWDLTKQ